MLMHRGVDASVPYTRPSPWRGRTGTYDTVGHLMIYDRTHLREKVLADDGFDLCCVAVTCGVDQTRDNLPTSSGVAGRSGASNELVDEIGEKIRQHEGPVARRRLSEFGVDTHGGNLCHVTDTTPGQHWVNTGFRATIADVTEPMPEDTLSTFAAAEWAFASRERTEEFHPYPARFIPELPRQVIRLAGRVDGAVLDPFCGSGTTLHEARRAGLDTVGSDINPIACLISRVRSTPLGSSDAGVVTTAAREIALLASNNSELDSRFLNIPRVDHWFTLSAQLAMAAASSYIESVPMSPVARDIVRAGVSAATVRISNQDSDTRYAAVQKNRSQVECATILSQSILKTLRWVERNTTDLGAETSLAVREGDAQDLSWIASGSVGLACFSPPYPNAYEYWLYHKYRMYWLGFDPISVRGQEMGARPHYSKRNGLDETDFQDQMTRVYEELHRVLRPGALAVAIVGDSVIGGRNIDNGELLSRAAKSAGLEPLGIVVRPIAVRRSSFNRAHSRGRVSEHVVIARRES